MNYESYSQSLSKNLYCLSAATKKKKKIHGVQQDRGYKNGVNALRLSPFSQFSLGLNEVTNL